MPLEPQRYKYYKSQLGDLLQSTTALIRHYYTTLCAQTPQLIVQADRIWEMSQRQRLVAGMNETAASILLSACHDAFQSIYHCIKQLKNKVVEIYTHVVDFERVYQALKSELSQVEELRRCPLAKWNAWLAQTLRVVQTQVKFLELDSRALLPALIESSTIKQFQRDLELKAHYKASICLGLAQAERRSELLPPTWTD